MIVHYIIDTNVLIDIYKNDLAPHKTMNEAKRDKKLNAIKTILDKKECHVLESVKNEFMPDDKLSETIKTLLKVTKVDPKEYNNLYIKFYKDIYTQGEALYQKNGIALESHPASSGRIKDTDVELVAYAIFLLKVKKYDEVKIITNEKLSGNISLDNISARQFFKIPSMIIKANELHGVNIDWIGEIKRIEDLDELFE